MYLFNENLEDKINIEDFLRATPHTAPPYPSQDEVINSVYLGRWALKNQSLLWLILTVQFSLHLLLLGLNGVPNVMHYCMAWWIRSVQQNFYCDQFSCWCHAWHWSPFSGAAATNSPVCSYKSWNRCSQTVPPELQDSSTSSCTEGSLLWSTRSVRKVPLQGIWSERHQEPEEIGLDCICLMTTYVLQDILAILHR